MDSLAGRLLVSNASLFDPNFRRTVVLVGHHDEEGAVGVVLNRALDVRVDEAVPPLAELVPPGDPLFSGGPVEPDAAVVVADFEDPSVVDVIAFGTVGFLPPDGDAVDGIRRARVFAGYSGWGPGQLEGELEEEAWLVAPALPDDVFSDQPARLWDVVVGRLGPAHALLRSMPYDPSAN